MSISGNPLHSQFPNNMALPIPPIMEQSFAVINQEIGEHNFSPAEYAIVQRLQRVYSKG